MEAALLAGVSTWRCVQLLAPRFGVTPRTIRQDVWLIERRWARDDARDLDRNRTAVVRRLTRVAMKAERAGDYGAATTANVALGRFLGMTVKAELELSARARVTVERPPIDVATWIPAFIECAAEVDLFRELLAKVGVPPPSPAGRPTLPVVDVEPVRQSAMGGAPV